MRPTEDIGTTPLVVPATGASGYGNVFTVGGQSVVCRLTTDTDLDAGVADAFELYTVIDYDKATGAVNLAYATKEIDPIGGTEYGFLLGSTNTQQEVMMRGAYVWKKILSTTPAVGVEAIVGFERGK